MPLDQTILDTQTAEDLKALEAFVVDNDDLLGLESIIGRFNIFDALGIARAEIRHFPDHRRLFVYLTPEGEEPSEGEWVSYSYSHIYRVLDRVRTTYNNAIGEDVLVFLDHYLNLIGTRFINETEESKRIDDLCQRIYKDDEKGSEVLFC